MYDKNSGKPFASKTAVGAKFKRKLEEKDHKALFRDTAPVTYENVDVFHESLTRF